MKISIVIPVYNEETRISRCVNELKRYIGGKKGQGYQFEVILVNDGSQDNTLPLLREMSGLDGLTILSNAANRGKGYSVRRGILQASGNYLFFSDADMSIPLDEIDKFLPWMERGEDVLIASRAVPGAKISRHQPRFRRFGGWLFRQVRRSLILPDIRDTQCGFKCFSRRAAQAIFPRQTMDGYIFDAEILCLARSLGFAILEIPITWHNDQASKVNYVSDSVQMFRGLLKIWYRSLRGHYNAGGQVNG